MFEKITTLKQIAFFDFDGTITTKDTLLEFIKFSKGKFYFYLGFLIYSPFLIAYKLKIISNQKAKEKILKFFFGKTDLTVFEEKCKAFSATILPALIRPKALQEIEKLQSIGTTIVVVSASPQNWIKPWANSISVELIATQLEIKSEKLTGWIQGKNCHGEEKVRQIQTNYSLADYDRIYAYGDTSGDRPMLRLATISFYKPFRNGKKVGI